jgi:inosine-uridine nucleoside N-ribohydrolase
LHQISRHAGGDHIRKYAHLRGNYNYLWDELAAAARLDPSLITKHETPSMDVDLERAGYGDRMRG